MILALDPGIDATGFAVVRVRPRILTPHQATNLLAASGTLRSSPKADLLTRLQQLCVQLTTLLDQWPGVTITVLERPKIGGTYRRHGGKIADSEIHARLAPMHLATGALAITALSHMLLRSGACEFVAAAGSHKQDRSMVLRSIFPQLTKSNQDQRDAVWLALMVLTDGRRQWPEVAHGA